MADITVKFGPDFPALDLRHDAEATKGATLADGVRRDAGGLRGLEGATGEALPASPVRGLCVRRSTGDTYVAAGSTLYRRARGATGFTPVTNPDGTSVCVLPGTGPVRLIEYNEKILVQAM